MVYSNVLEAIGHTPMIRLSKIVPKGSADVLVKYEGVNIGGSIKTRTAYNKFKYDTCGTDKRKPGDRACTYRSCQRLPCTYNHARFGQ